MATDSFEQLNFKEDPESFTKEDWKRIRTFVSYQMLIIDQEITTNNKIQLVHKLHNVVSCYYKDKNEFKKINKEDIIYALKILKVYLMKDIIDIHDQT